MKVIVQRVQSASVAVNDTVISSIGKGICVLVGIHAKDTPKERETIVRKLLNLRAFEDENGKRWTKSVKDLNLEVLCVSQFTLYHTMKGNKPDFRHAMTGDEAKDYYAQFLEELMKNHPGGADKIKNGQFGAMMQVHIQNDGPVTLELEALPTVKDSEKTVNSKTVSDNLTTTDG